MIRKHRKRNKNKATYPLCKDKFSRLSKHQIQDIYEDYREYLHTYSKLHLTKDNFDMLVSDNYYHNELKNLKQAAKFLHYQYRLCFFLGEDYKILKNTDDAASIAAHTIYSYAEGWGMDVLRTYFYDYTYDDTAVDDAWEDTRFDDYLDEYAKNNPEKLKNNPWDNPELQKHFWHWRDRLSWYRQQQKSAVIETIEKPLSNNDIEIFRIAVWDNNVPAFVTLEKILFTDNIENFQDRWFKLQIFERGKEEFIIAKNGEEYMIKKGTAHIFSDKTFIVNDAWVSAINWFGSHRKFHINKWEIRVKWISFQDKYYRIVSHKANGICKLEIFPKLMVAVEECNGNYLLKCEAKFCPKYSMAIPKNKWQKTTFEDFNDNYINSICYITHSIFNDEETLKQDISELTIRNCRKIT